MNSASSFPGVMLECESFTACHAVCRVPLLNDFPGFALLKQLENLRVKAALVRHAVQNLKSLIQRDRFFLRPVGSGQRLKDVENREKSDRHRNRVAVPVIRIAGSVHQLVVRRGPCRHFCKSIRKLDTLKNLPRHRDMTLDHAAFCLRERAFADLQAP